jgi:hypothetical protein
MAHLYKVSNWQSASKWYCNDTADLAGIAGKWWVPARMLGMSLTDYILLLKDQFHANIVSYNSITDVLIFNWESYSEMHKYELWINSMARKANFIV